MNFDDAYTSLLGIEGKYWNDPVGGPTMYGVTQKVARTWGYTGDMKDLPLVTAKAIAKALYWTPNPCDDFPFEIAYQVFDTAYNGGYAIRWLQQALGATVDGKVGPQTIALATNANVYKVMARFNAYRLKYLVTLDNWPPNSRGWVNRIAENLLKG